MTFTSEPLFGFFDGSVSLLRLVTLTSFEVKFNDTSTVTTLNTKHKAEIHPANKMCARTSVFSCIQEGVELLSIELIRINPTIQCRAIDVCSCGYSSDPRRQTVGSILKALEASCRRVFQSVVEQGCHSSFVPELG
jgi:hypothetical protein